MKPKPPHSSPGFTLTELLVVLLVVLVLAALLGAGVPKAIYLAKQAKSSANLRLMGGALMSYVSEHDGRLPEGAFRPTLGGSKVRYWFNALDHYLGGSDYTTEGSKREFRPAWQNDPLKVYRAPIWDGGFAVHVGYGWNHSFFGYTADWYPERMGWGSRLVQAEKPSETIIIGTSSDSTNNSLGNLLIYPNVTSAARRYNGKGLYLLLDGHVEAYTPEQIVASNQYLMKKTKD